MPMEYNRIKRRKQRRRKRNMIIGVIILLLLLIVFLVIVIINKPKEQNEIKEVHKEIQKIQEAESENAKKLLEQCYSSVLSKDKTSFDASVNDKTFSEWLFENFPEKKIEKLLDAAKDHELSEAEIYHSLGESLHVLSDRYEGLLKDAETASQNHIYIREGKVKREVEITIAGDLCLTEDGFVIDKYDTVNDLKQCISPEILRITNESDLFYINHEYTISDRGTPLAGKYYTFRAKPERMNLLKEMGTDIVSLANNHVYDYGEEALLDTADLLEESAGILRAYDTTEYNQVISEASKECDYLIAYIHWGTEDSNYLNSDQQRWGREFLDSGADIVIGGHPHVLQGIEYVDGKPIIYSLGDFWFNHETKYTGVLKLNIQYGGLKEMSFVPCLQTNFTTQYLERSEEQEELYDFLEELSPNIQIDSQGIITQKQN